MIGTLTVPPRDYLQSFAGHHADFRPLTSGTIPWVRNLYYPPLNPHRSLAEPVVDPSRTEEPGRDEIEEDTPGFDRCRRTSGESTFPCRKDDLGAHRQLRQRRGCAAVSPLHQEIAPRGSPSIWIRVSVQSGVSTGAALTVPMYFMNRTVGIWTDATAYGPHGCSTAAAPQAVTRCDLQTTARSTQSTSIPPLGRRPVIAQHCAMPVGSIRERHTVLTRGEQRQRVRVHRTDPLALLIETENRLMHVFLPFPGEHCPCHLAEPSNTAARRHPRCTATV